MLTSGQAHASDETVYISIKNVEKIYILHLQHPDLWLKAWYNDELLVQFFLEMSKFTSYDFSLRKDEYRK